MRVLSYNIHKGIGGRDRRYRLERIVAAIEHENPDILCLQEVDRNVRRSGYDDQPKLLAEAFYATASLYQLNYRVRKGGYGNQIVSRWPFRSKHQVSLRIGIRKPRGAQIVVIETPEGPLHLVNWHLGLMDRERHRQVERLLRHPSFRESEELPTLIIGDTNDWRNTLGKGPFARHGFHAATAPPSKFRSFPAYLPVAALDKAFHRGDLIVRQARVAHSKVARDASDHLPLIVDIHLPDAPSLLRQPIATLPDEPPT